MASLLTSPGITWIRWHPQGLEVDFFVDAEQHVRMHSVRPEGQAPITYSLGVELEHTLCLAQIRLRGEGSTFGTSERLVFSATSQRLVYVSHKEWVETADDGAVYSIEIVTHDPLTNIQVRSHYSVYGGIPVLRSTTFVENKDPKTDVFLQTASSLSLGYLNRGVDKWWDEYEVAIANNTNFREAQWKTFSLPDLGVDYVGASDFDRPGTRASVVKSNLGTFSTSGSLPMGALARKDGKSCLVWQIEHSGAWRWELGNIVHGLYLVAGGPTDQDHQWTRKLAPGATFASVTTALAVVAGRLEDAFVPLTSYRRRMRRKHADNDALPVVFNDFMNCLKGDPTEDKLDAFIEPVRRAGAEYFVIDAGWYADEPGPDWWDTVGAWEPARARFPAGLKAFLDKIRAAGMIPGLWIEPEVIGLKSSVVADKTLPDEAYFQRDGVRVVEQSRYQLDFRHKAVTDRLSAIVANLVTNYGVGYLKIDYNIDVTHGTDVNATSPGDGMLEHRRAYMAWVNSLYDRFPSLVLESCASGGMRMDYHTLGTHSMISTSDQTDPVLYAAIAAAVPTAVTPEQSGTWAYPQPGYSDDLIALCVVNAMMGRIHLSGRVDLLSAPQLALVAEGIAVYKAHLREHIKASAPFWPLGLATSFHQDWLVLGLKSGAGMFLAVWRRGGQDEVCEIPLLALKGLAVKMKTLYPTTLPTEVVWGQAAGVLTVTIPVAPAARIIHVAP